MNPTYTFLTDLCSKRYITNSFPDSIKINIYNTLYD